MSRVLSFPANDPGAPVAATGVVFGSLDETDGGGHSVSRDRAPDAAPPADIQEGTRGEDPRLQTGAVCVKHSFLHPSDGRPRQLGLFLPGGPARATADRSAMEHDA